MTNAQEQGWFGRHPYVARLALLTGSVLGALIFAELLTRIVLPDLAPTSNDRVRYWVYDEQLGWKHRPSQRGRLTHPEFDIEVTINSDGMRDAELSPAAAPHRRALVLGDSFGWGFGVEHGERFDTLIENRHENWEFVNASVVGYGTDQQYIWLRNNIEQYESELVLLLLYENDFTNNRASAQYWHYKPKFIIEDGALQLTNVPVPEATLAQHLQRFVIGRTYLYGYLFRTVIMPISLGRQAASIQRDRERGLLTKPNISANEMTGALIAAIKQLCVEKGIPFVLVSVPGADRYREFLTQFSDSNAIDYLALDQSFSSVDESEYIIPQDRHWNAYGHALAADAIDDYLQQLGMFAVKNELNQEF